MFNKLTIPRCNYRFLDTSLIGWFLSFDLRFDLVDVHIQIKVTVACIDAITAGHIRARDGLVK